MLRVFIKIMRFALVTTILINDVATDFVQDNVCQNWSETQQELDSDMCLFVPIIPDSCKDDIFCDDVPNYPVEHATKKMEQMLEAGVFPVFNSIDEPVEVPHTMQLCDTKTHIVTPLAVKVNTGQWYFVLNVGENYVQNVKVIICENVHEPCNSSLYKINNGFETTCEQVFINKYVMIIDRCGQLLLKNIEKYPCGCSCKIYRMNEFHDCINQPGHGGC